MAYEEISKELGLFSLHREGWCVGMRTKRNDCQKEKKLMPALCELVGSHGLALLLGNWSCQEPYRLGRSCPLPCPSFSSVSSNSLQELQSKRPGSQTAPWKQHGCIWVGWMRKNSISPSGLPDGIATTWGWDVFNNSSDKLKSLAGFFGTAAWKH